MAKEYIEREAVRLAYERSLEANAHNIVVARAIHSQEHRHILHVLDKIPAADVVEVVRCKECKRGSILCEYDNGDVLLDCIAHGGEIVAPDDYCSDGERRDGGA